MYGLFIISKTPADPIIGYTSHLVACGPPKKAPPRSCQLVRIGSLVDMFYYVGLLRSRGMDEYWWVLSDVSVVGRPSRMVGVRDVGGCR